MIYPAKLAHQATALLVALAAKDNDTGRQPKRVATIAQTIGRKLELEETQLQTLKYGSLLHDIGKLRTPDSVLKKPARLSESERDVIRQHPGDGYSILAGLGFPDDVARVVLEHHENFDGSGYPFGKIGTFISIEARVLSVADTYDAITCDRVYRKGASDAVARKEIVDWSGVQFDPTVVEAFLQCEPIQ